MNYRDEDIDADEEAIELLTDNKAPSDTVLVDGIDVNKLVNRPLWDDMLDAFHQSKYALFLSCIVLLLLSYQFFIGQYSMSPRAADIPVRHTWDSLVCF